MCKFQKCAVRVYMCVCARVTG